MPHAAVPWRRAWKHPQHIARAPPFLFGAHAPRPCAGPARGRPGSSLVIANLQFQIARPVRRSARPRCRSALRPGRAGAGVPGGSPAAPIPPPPPIRPPRARSRARAPRKAAPGAARLHGPGASCRRPLSRPRAAGPDPGPPPAPAPAPGRKRMQAPRLLYSGRPSAGQAATRTAQHNAPPNRCAAVAQPFDRRTLNTRPPGASAPRARAPPARPRPRPPLSVEQPRSVEQPPTPAAAEAPPPAAPSRPARQTAARSQVRNASTEPAEASQPGAHPRVGRAAAAAAPRSPSVTCCRAAYAYARGFARGRRGSQDGRPADRERPASGSAVPV